MIYRIIVALALACPLIGVFLMEAGASSQSLSREGHWNYASLAMAFYVAIFLIVVVLLSRSRRVIRLGAGQESAANSFNPIAIWSLVLLILMAAFVLFGLGGFYTLFKTDAAGSFRANLGSGGALGYLILKFYAPAILTNLALRAPQNSAGRAIVGISAVLVILVSLSFGYKTAIAIALLPACIALMWRTNWKAIAIVAALSSVVIVVGYLRSPPVNPNDFSLPQLIAYRIFVLNGEVPWKIWDMHMHGETFPIYSKTLSVIFGDRVYTYFTGVTKADAYTWVMSHFSLMTTYVVGYQPKYIIEVGHNVSANAFSEGVILGGLTGVAAIAILGATITACLYYFIKNRLEAKDSASASVGVCYFIYGLVAWFLGGGIVSLVHVALMFGVITTFLLLRGINGQLRVYPRRDAVVRASSPSQAS